jgi:hypothetical protein
MAATLTVRPDHVFAHPFSTAAKISEELPLELEEDAQHLGDDEDHLAMRDIRTRHGEEKK